MKLSTLSKLVGAGALTLSAAIMPLSLPASAQNTTTPNTGTETTQPGTTTTTTDTATDDGFDWGWLGLIGLAGLAGLAGRKREEPARYRDPADRATTSYRE